MALLQTASKGCHRLEELFRAAGAVSCQDSCTREVVPTKGSYKDIIQGHTGVIHQSQKAIPLGERPHTHLMLLAPQPGLVEMTLETMSRHDYQEGV